MATGPTTARAGSAEEGEVVVQGADVVVMVVMVLAALVLVAAAVVEEKLETLRHLPLHSRNRWTTT
jgi:hypothetical protein